MSASRDSRERSRAPRRHRPRATHRPSDAPPHPLQAYGDRAIVAASVIGPQGAARAPGRQARRPDRDASPGLRSLRDPDTLAGTVT
jgi:hypothetical protein